MMKTPIMAFFLFVFIVIRITGFAQLNNLYHFQKDDTLLKKQYYEEALQTQNALMNSLTGEYKKDYKEIYESRFKQISTILQSSSVVTDPEVYQYLQSLLKKITDANAELKPLKLRLFFSRDASPNAYSMGEGTIVINAGLMIFLNNEAELVFVLCHELSHYYLDHTNKAIKKNVEMVNNETFKKELKRLSKQEYRVGQQLDVLLKDITFSSRQHSRTNETEADRRAYLFMKNTGYNCNGITTCLQMLDKVDDSLFNKPLHLEQLFNFSNYPFKKKWIQNESVIFGQMSNDNSQLTTKEKDSLKTHPDCEKRILLLKDSVMKSNTGQLFLINELYFKQLKKDFLIEMTEQLYRDDNLTRNLYYNLIMLQHGDNLPFAIYSISRALNKIYISQKQHQLGMITEKEDRAYPMEYNLLLRMFDRLRLDEIAELSFQFCSYYQSQMNGYKEFETEMEKAKQYKKLN